MYFKKHLYHTSCQGGMRHTKWMCFKAPDWSTFVQSLWKYYCGHYYCSSKGSVGTFIYLINDIEVKEWRCFIFGKIWCFCSQRRRKVFFMADVICICIETIFVHQNLYILYVSILYIFHRSFVNPFLCYLCWKMNWNTKVTYFELLMFLYVCLCLHYLSETTD